MKTDPMSPQTPAHRSGRTPTFVICLLITAVLVPGGFGQSVAAAPFTQETPPDRLPYDVPFDMPYMETDPAPQEAPPALTAPEYVNWSRLVFQSFRNQHDWEIFAARGDGSNQVNVSNHASMDTDPRLNRDGTRVVFASNRHGTFEIYAMNADGSGQTRLTNNSTNDAFPAWAPDGSKIAFQAYRDGQAEIYVMNANGSGQTRLTNHAEYDGQPAWSPDGAKIAFVRKQSGQYRIWIMNANGSNPQQRSGQPISEDPAWSPDGSKIAYDADGNNDGWQEIWLMDAGGGNQRPVYYPSQSNTDAWVYSWSPDGRYVAFTSISWVYQQSQWYWTRAYLDAWDSANPNDTIRLSNNGADWYPDWRSLDWQAPLSQMQPLPAQSPSPFTVRWSGSDAGPAGLANYDVQVKDGAGGVWTNWHMATTATSAAYSGVGGHTYTFRARARDNAGNVETWPASHDAVTIVEALSAQTSVLALLPFSRNGVLVHWAGSDPGGSGIQNYDVQLRQGNGSWADWRMGTTATSSAFTGTSGSTYGFRVRARDNAQNLEAWPADNAADTSTTIYAWQLAGRLTDNRGVMVGQTPLSIAPPPIQAPVTAANGSFVAYLAASGDYTLSVSRTGYGLLNPPAFPVNRDRTLELYLPPIQNLLANGGFESGLPLPLDWTVDGPTDAATISANAHTGSRALMLGKTCPYPCMSESQLIASFANSYPDMASDSLGNQYLAWAGFDGGNPQVRLAIKPPGGPWSAPQNLGPLMNGSDWRVGIALDGHDTAHVVWSQNDGLYYRQRPPGMQWSAAQRLASIGDGVDIAGDRQGGVHVIYHDSEHVRYLERLPSGVWQPSVVLDSGNGYRGPGIAVGPDDSVHFIYQQINQGVFYRWRSTGGAILPAEQLWSGTGYSFQHQNLAVAGDGTVHAVINWQGAYYRRKPVGGAWSTTESLNVYAACALATDAAGTLHVAGWTGYGPYVLYYRNRLANGVWQSTVPLGDSNDDGPALTIDPQGQVHLVNFLMSPSQGLYYWTSLVASEAFTVTASQEVTIPANMHRPTVAANYASLGGGSPLSIWVGNGISTTQVLSAPVNNQWQLAYADLSPWAGQDVTVTFQLQQVADTSYTRLLLDDATLGEWPTPVITAIDPAQGQAWSATPVVIHGVNFVDTPTVRVGSIAVNDVDWIDEHTLNAVVPATLAPGIYNVRVENPGGAASVRAGAFRAGRACYLPLVNK